MNIAVIILLVVLLGSRQQTGGGTGGGTGGIPPIGIGGACTEKKRNSMLEKIAGFKLAGTGSYAELTAKAARNDWTGWANKAAKLAFDINYSTCPGYNTW